MYSSLLLPSLRRKNTAAQYYFSRYDILLRTRMLTSTCKACGKIKTASPLYNKIFGKIYRTLESRNSFLSIR